MKIVLIGPVYPYRGGIAHYTTHLAHTLAEHAHSVTVHSFRRQYPAWLYPGQSDRDPSQMPLKIQADFYLDPLYPWTWFSLADRLAHSSPDLVLINWWTTFWAPADAVLKVGLKRAGVRLVYLVHNVLPHEEKPWDAWLARLALAGAPAFLAHTPHEADRLARLVPSERISLCPLPVFDMFSLERLSRADAKTRLGLPRDIPVILFFGFIRPYKGLHHLLAAAEVLAKLQVRFLLLVAGEFWEDKSEYISQIELLNLGERVRLVDRYIPNEEIGLYFSAADVFAAPYTGGSQSGAIKIAIDYQLPVVASQVIADELVRQAAGPGLRLVDPLDPEGLAQALVSAWSEPPRIVSPSEDTLTVKASWHRLVQNIERAAGFRPAPD
jgi:glycosyltransferase involved in cell wall biosynthesis